MKRITVIVPCFNEEEVLKLFYQEIKKYLVKDYEYNILFVNDGSRDNTFKVIMELQKEDKRIKYISFSKNFGKEAAMLAGLNGAKTLNSDAAIFIDADLQDPPSLIIQMLEQYEAGYKHIYAKHRKRIGEPALKTFFAKMFYKVYSLITKDKNISKGARDFCLMDRAVIDAFLAIKDLNRFTKGIFSFVGFEKKYIEFDYIPRAAGKTKWSFKKLYKYAWMGIKQFSHVHLLIPRLLIFTSFLFLVFDTIFSIINKNFSYQIMAFEILFVFVFIAIYVLVKLVYEVRDQGLNRPIYIIEDSNVYDERKNYKNI